MVKHAEYGQGLAPLEAQTSLLQKTIPTIQAIQTARYEDVPKTLGREVSNLDNVRAEVYSRAGERLDEARRTLAAHVRPVDGKAVDALDPYLQQLRTATPLQLPDMIQPAEQAPADIYARMGALAAGAVSNTGNDGADQRQVAINYGREAIALTQHWHAADHGLLHIVGSLAKAPEQAVRSALNGFYKEIETAKKKIPYSARTARRPFDELRRTVDDTLRQRNVEELAAFTHAHDALSYMLAGFEGYNYLATREGRLLLDAFQGATNAGIPFSAKDKERAADLGLLRNGDILANDDQDKTLTRVHIRLSEAERMHGDLVLHTSNDWSRRE